MYVVGYVDEVVGDGLKELAIRKIQFKGPK